MSKGKHLAPKTRTGRVSALTLGLILGLFLAMSIPTAAAPWTMKVTGGGWASAGSTDFSLTMSASDTGGQWQYDREGQSLADLTMHGTIDCLWVSEDEAVAVMSGPTTHVSVGSWADYTAIAVMEGGNGSGDKVRIWSVSSGWDCTIGNTSFPGTYFDGTINIRTR